MYLMSNDALQLGSWMRGIFLPFSTLHQRLECDQRWIKFWWRCFPNRCMWPP